MIIIEGTPKIKGAIDLTGINKQLKNGDKLPITDQEFLDHSVQIAIDMGFIKKLINEVDDLPPGMITLKNVSGREILINILQKSIRPGQTFTLSNDDVNTPDIRGALSKGMLDIVSSARPTPGKEATVKVGNLFDEKEKKTDETDDSIDVIPDSLLETNEEIIPTKIIEEEDPDPVDTADIPDPKKKSIVWNPNKEPSLRQKTETDVLSTGEKKEELSFVDKELDEEKLKSHPVLKDKPLENNDELEFL